jgi:hypothetical protein
MDKLAKDMGPNDSSNCFIMEFDEGEPLKNLICIVDINEHENALSAFNNGFTKV